jgi:DNA phosphorothioation-dependent restriction protein DptG
VDYVRFYLDVLHKCIQRKPETTIDWQESWQLNEVTPAQWEKLKERLKETYRSVRTTMKGLEAWEGEDDIGASLGIRAHTAYHLGAIRQALQVIR